MIEKLPELQQNPIKDQWLAELAGFIIEAGRNGWAGDASSVEITQRPGFEELSYERDEWGYRDSYSGYFMGPGSSVISYKEKPVWYMSYGGAGQTEEFYDHAEETFVFLRKALLMPTAKFPVRGPLVHSENDGNKIYWLDYQGSLAEGSWTETILFDHKVYFKQRGEVGLIIDKDQNRAPILPWLL